MTTEQEALNKLRDKIDNLDKKIQVDLNQRAQLALDVATVKQSAAAEGETVVYYRPEREAQVLQKVMERNAGPLGNETMARLFREIMSACLALEEPMKVAFLGPEGTFTQGAALKHFGHGVTTVPMAAIDEVFREVESGAALFGVVPVENSTGGVVNHTLDSFMQSNLHIVGEVDLRIHHHLLLGPNTKKESISRIYSHQQSLAQCRKWLDAEMPNVERIAVSSNAEAAKRLQNEWNAAAIAGSVAAELYGLEKIHENIEDSPDNTTRFLIIGRDPVPPSGEDKTSIMVSMKNNPGALSRLLGHFSEHNIDLTRIESRPASTGTWSYVFFVDFYGHESEKIVATALNNIEDDVLELRRLGSYPKAVL